MLTDLRRFFQNLWRGWDEFFFAPQSGLPAAVFRFAFALNTLIMYAIRLKDWRFYFTDAGFLPVNGVFDIVPEFYRPLFSWYPQTESVALAMNVGLIVCLVLLLVGLIPRLAALGGLILHVGLIQRNYSVAYGADFIATFMFFALVFIKSDRRFSFTTWMRARQNVQLSADDGSLSQIVSSAFVRVMQIQLCLIYMYTGLEKMKGASWWDGSAIWAVIGNQQIMFIDASWLKNIPLAIAAMTFLTLLFEIYFTPLVWNRHLRKWILILGCFMHLGIALSIGLFYFSFGMMSVYFLWADPEWLARTLRRVRVSQAWLG